MAAGCGDDVNSRSRRFFASMRNKAEAREVPESTQESERNAGIFRFVPSYRFNKHNHKETEIVYIKSGHCIMGVSEKYVPLREGDCIVLPKGVPHWFLVDKKDSCQIAQLEFYIEIPDEMNTGMELYRQVQYYKFSECEPVKDLIESICKLHRSDKLGKYKELQMDLMFVQLFIEFAAKLEEQDSYEQNGKIEEIVNYVNENYENDICIEDVAKQFGVSSRYIRKCFKKETGINCSQYITSLRIEKAKELLWSSNKTVTEVALMTGFNSSQYFCRVFQHQTGKMPLEYRNLWKGKKAEEHYAIELEEDLRLKDHDVEKYRKFYQKPLAEGRISTFGAWDMKNRRTACT